MRVSRLLNLWRNDRGNTLILVAGGMPLVIGAAALSVDSINLVLASRELQRSADSAALAGAYALLQSRPVGFSVGHDLTLNNRVPLAAAPTVENAPTVGPYTNNMRAVRVVLSAQRAVPFMAFFRSPQMSISAEATAAVVYSGQFCVIALETASITAVSFAGNSSVDLGCGVMSNSAGAEAVSASGSSRVVASPISAVGRVPASGSYVGETTLLPYAAPESDPFAALPTPAVPTPCNERAQVQPNETETLTPGCYADMDIKGTVTFSPGTYIIDGGSLSFGATAVATGVGVTFVLTSRTAASNPSSIADLRMNGGAVLDFTAPADGTYKGILMYKDRRAPYGGDLINGNSGSRFQGAFYFPSQELTFSGNSGVRTECLQFVARRMVFTGNSHIQNQCPANGGSEAFDATMVRLVG